MSSFIAYHVVADTQYVLDSDPAKYPRRSTSEQAIADVHRAWHHPGKDEYATHLILYRIDGETVRPMHVEVHRRVEARV